MLKIAIYGKGGIGKSTVTSNLAAAFAAMGKRVIQIGCDPKADSTINLLGGTPVEPVMNFMRRTDRDPESLEEISRQGFGGILCIETGGPTPGLTVDKFGEYLSFQVVSLGLEQWKQEILEILVELFHPKGIYERDDLPVREKEGLEQIKKCVYGQVPDRIEIREHDARMLVSIPQGQKTGHFLDQQENRGILKDYVKGKTVLDLCCCSGGFSIHAGLYGAKRVDAVDVSESALELVRENAALNGLDNVNTVCENVFDLAKESCENGKQYDVVILDPPAFAKSRRVLESAYKGYKELNYRCMKLTKPGGFMLTCSCSQFMTKELFLKMLREAARDSGRQVRLIREVMQSRDHPAAIGEESALYLKGWVLSIW